MHKSGHFERPLASWTQPSRRDTCLCSLSSQYQKWESEIKDLSARHRHHVRVSFHCLSALSRVIHSFRPKKVEVDVLVLAESKEEDSEMKLRSSACLLRLLKDPVLPEHRPVLL